jgi:hypothetical protein
MTNSRITFDAFIASLKVTPESDDAVAIAMKVLGRELTEEDVQSDDIVSFMFVISLARHSEYILDRNHIFSLRWMNFASKNESELIVSLSLKLSVVHQAPTQRTLHHDRLHGPHLPERNIHNHQSPAILRPRYSNIAIQPL